MKLLLLLALALLLASTCQANLCSSYNSSDRADLTQLSEVHACKGVSPWSALEAVWTPLRFQISCSTSDYSVFIGNSEESLQEAISNNDALVWCGLESLNDSRKCTKSVSPYGTTLVGIKTHGGFIPRASKGQGECKVVGAPVRNNVLPIMVVAGTLLFWNAGYLSTSKVFRIGTGTSMFVMAFLLVLLFAMFKMVPQRKFIISSLVAASSTALGIVRWLYGHWLPSLSTIVTSPWVIGYVTIAVVIGMAVTYYYDDTSNQKLNNILRAALHVLGLVLLCFGTTTWAASGVFVALLLLAYSLQDVFRPRIAALLMLPVQLVASVLALPVQLLRWLYSKIPASKAAQVRDAASVPLPEDEEVDLSATPGQGLKAFLEERRAADAIAASQPSTSATAEAGYATPGPSAGLQQPAAGPLRFRLSPPHSPRVRALHGYNTPQAPIEAPTDVDPDTISPMVKAGVAYNPDTGKTIKIGGARYNELIIAGYTLDAQQGVLVAPPGGGRAGGRSRGARQQTPPAPETSGGSMATRSKTRQQ